ncbi:hypothetical protein FBQ87_12355 [Sphingobacteriales bacterium CHB3]|nr:hypothetical protein [Sphingobacteriales bacterium CHB3]
MKKNEGAVVARAAITIAALALLLPACSSFYLPQVDYGWPVESVLSVNENNTVTEGRYAISFNVAPLAQEEFENPQALKGKEIRLLRSTEGMYYVTGPRFKHVYVMVPNAGELKLHRKYEVSEHGLSRPALNQREPYVELIDGGNLRLLMTSDDILEEKDLRAEGRK